jgi:hypothetical protein
VVTARERAVPLSRFTFALLRGREGAGPKDGAERTREGVESEPPLRPAMTGSYRLWPRRWLALLMPCAASGERDLAPECGRR